MDKGLSVRKEVFHRNQIITECEMNTISLKDATSKVERKLNTIFITFVSKTIEKVGEVLHNVGIRSACNGA